VFPDDNHENRGLWRTYFSHVQCVLNSNVVDREGLDKMKLGWRYGRYLSSDGRYVEAEVQYLEAFEVDEKALGQEHPDTLTSMGQLASTY
jgi:hypothetical protein